MTISKSIRLAITDLADFACREGDLMPYSVIGPSAKEGMQAHKRLQAMRKDESDNSEWIVSEFAVKYECEQNGLTIQVGGRIDLVDTRKHRISEIKTTLVPASEVPDWQRALQWAQVYLYGFVYIEQAKEDIEALELELVHVNIRADTQTSDVRTVSASEVATFFSNAISCYSSWMQKIQAWNIRLEASTKDLAFPFAEFRAGQRDMAVAVYRAGRDASPLLCEAPTGIGKTMSSLYPAMKLMGEQELTQLLYLTAKVSGQKSAFEAVYKLRDAGLQVTAISIRSKELSCFCSNGRCERDSTNRCPMTLGFFDRLPQARDELLAMGIIDATALDEVAWEHQLCPFELVQQLLPWMQLVIADYNYVFDPLVRLAHYSRVQKHSVLLVDEVHNLVDRSRSMYSAEVSRLNCLEASAECRRSHSMIAQDLDKLAKRLLSVGGAIDEECTVTRDVPVSLTRTISGVLESISIAMSEGPALGECTAKLWKALCRFVVISELFSEQHRCLTYNSRCGKAREVRVVLFCLDASKELASSYKMFKTTVVFSATLRPSTFYKDTLGLGSDTHSLQLASPFSAHKCYRAVVDWIDTRYRQRQSSLGSLVELIYECTSMRSGNYIVFFPSYIYLQQALDLFAQLYPQRATWAQTRGQSRTEHEQLLEELDTPGHRVGFAIQGGVFGEGINYHGDRLIGTIIVGTGLPGTDQQSELIAEHYSDSGHNGYDFTYRYPGFTRVLQTAGRVIRSTNDTGFVLLVDHRFKQHSYRSLFPADWVVNYPKAQIQLQEALEGFWEGCG